MVKPVACVIGWPVKHSRSPVIHRFWLNELGLDGDYVIQPVEPERIVEFLATFPSSGFVGCNVTVPHKEAAFAAVARREPAAEETGALNTVWIEDGAWAPTPTRKDPGHSHAVAPGWDACRTGVVLGAGGAARAIVWALIRRGFAPVAVVNRTRERAEALAARFGPSVAVAGWESLPDLLGDARVLVNTTTLGMHGQPLLDVDVARLPPDAVVNDLIYVPMETPLITSATVAGLTAVGGLGMLLHQAVPGFTQWFGKRPRVTPALRALVQKSIEAG
jgi:shikimate dehydrogenase